MQGDCVNVRKEEVFWCSSVLVLLLNKTRTLEHENTRILFPLVVPQPFDDFLEARLLPVHQDTGAVDLGSDPNAAQEIKDEDYYG